MIYLTMKLRQSRSMSALTVWKNYRHLVPPVLELTSIYRKFANDNRIFFAQATKNCDSTARLTIMGQMNHLER